MSHDVRTNSPTMIISNFFIYCSWVFVFHSYSLGIFGFFPYHWCFTHLTFTHKKKSMVLLVYIALTRCLANPDLQYNDKKPTLNA